MKQTLIDLMLYLGSALMAYNIYQYVRFSRHVREHGNWERERRLFHFPIVLLVLFLLGYVSVALFGQPDLVVSGILFGGSIFVLAMLILIQRTVDRIQENERLEAKLLAAEEASRAKTLFLSNMSHDIRTPLNAIIGYTTLARGGDVSPEQKNAYIAKIEKASHQLLGIVNDVLEMSRIESGRMELQPSPTHLPDCIREAADLVRSQMEDKRIHFSSFCETAHPWVMCDSIRLNRALMNLLCNAAKFTPEQGAVSLSLRELAQDGDMSQYEIRVEDTGIGMSPEFVEKVFTPFERERTSTVSKIQGTGLGMAIAKSIVDVMGGEIQVQSQQGKGTAFIITLSLPIVETDRDAERQDAQVDFSGVRVLLVEDNEINMEIASAILQQAGVTVERAENGQRAVEKVRASAPGDFDLILMDVQMPVMDGYAATKAIRSLPDAAQAGLPILAMTANAFVEDIRAAESAGMNGHIAKPIDRAVLLKTIAETLARFRARP